MTLRHTSETVANVTAPVTLSVAGWTFLGYTLQDWVLIGTAVLLTFQLVAYLPKVIGVFRSLYRKLR